MGYTHSIICVVLITLCVVLIKAKDLKVGDSCYINGSGNPGICKLSINCPKAREALRFNSILPTSCGYEGFNQIVCCEQVVEATTVINSNIPIAVRKCQEYSKYVFVNISMMPMISFGTVNTISNNRCGNLAIKLIVGGTSATLNEFPHSALVGIQEVDGRIKWHCGGSLVSTRYVLTAGHCLIKSITSGLDVSHVRLGELVLHDENDGATPIDVRVEQIIKNPKYRKSKRYHDIALLKLVEKVTLSPYIRPICLPTEDLNPPKVIATGWGSVRFYGERSNALLKVVLELYNNTECDNSFKMHQDRKLPRGIIESQLCAGWRSLNRDTCQGDSGGPLQIYHPDVYCMYTQVGIISYGFGCGTHQLPGIYTRVYSYVPWIESVIWAPGEDD